MKIRISSPSAILLFLSPALIFVAAELGLRWRQELILRKPQCAIQDKMEIFRLAPRCEAWEDSPNGPYLFRTNEDGFRDRSRSFFKNGALFLIGDSHVEGFRLREEEGLSRRLEESLGIPVLNLGLQGTGPGQELLRAERALKSYRPLGAIWLLNPTDVPDEIYFKAIASGEPNPLASPEIANRLSFRLDRWLGGRSRLIQKISEMQNLQGPFIGFMKNRHFEERIHCEALFEGTKRFQKEKIPLVFVLMGQGPTGLRQGYRGLNLDAAAFDRLALCAKASGAAVVDFREEFKDSGDYWPGDWHLHSAGTIKFSRILADRLRPFFGKQPVPSL